MYSKTFFVNHIYNPLGSNIGGACGPEWTLRFSLWKFKAKYTSICRDNLPEATWD